jgi:S-DNA-T family DNA segregation ATPase FtsK/SpoIIIE
MTDSNEPVKFSWEQAEEDLAKAETSGNGHHEPEPETRVLVDSPEAQRPEPLTLERLRAAERRPIVPAWLKSRAELLDAARWALGLATHTSAYHLSRTPKYAGKLALRTPAGLARGATAWAAWLLDAEGRPVRKALDRREDAEMYHKLAKHRDRRVRARTIVTAVTLAVLAAGLVGLALAPAWARVAAVLVAIGILGKAGQPQDKPLIERAVVVQKAPKLTSDQVTRALSVLQLAGINQALSRDAKAISFPAPITRDGGRGWRADVDLPPGVVAADIIERRDRLASGLGRPLGCVWPEPVPEVSPGRLMLFVADQDMASAKPVPWPLAKAGTVDLFKPFPFGLDPRGRGVPLEMMYSNLLIGSIPGMGKTFSLTVPLAAAVLDVRAELQVFELKGTGGLEPSAQVASRYASGLDDETIEQALVALRNLRQECVRRAKTIKGLPRAVCPENKVTSQLASRPELGLHPLVVAIDECQELFSHPEFGAEAGELAEKNIKLGRALGIILLLATQRPDARSLPTGVSANVGIRLCHRVMGQLENDMVLGTSAYKNGIRATMFSNRDKGVGYLVGAADDPIITRPHKIDGPAFERICARARELREAAGTLAVGKALPARRRDTLLEDILTVVPASEEHVWCQTAAERLADYRPEIYSGWVGEQVTLALKPYGVIVKDVWKGRSRRGFVRQHVVDALAERRRRGTPEAGS